MANLNPSANARINKALRNRNIPVTVLHEDTRAALIAVIRQAYFDGKAEGSAMKWRAAMKALGR